MSFLRKDTSWVNRIIFPAPKPASYNPDTFDPFGESCKLCYIPRKNAAVRRPADSEHDPNCVPCIWLPCSAPGASKILIYCHGNSEDIGHSAGMLAKMRDYLKVHVLGVEYPGYGLSPGSPSETGINNDLLVVYSFLTGVMKWPKQDIILYGFSIGTGPTTHLAASNEVGGLLLLAPYTSIRDMVPELLPSVGKFAQFLISNRFDNAKEIEKVTCPALFIHGRSDDLIPHRHSELLHSRCGSAKKELYLADTMKHCFDDNDLEAFVLFPMMGFFELKGAKRTCTFPPYVFRKPPAPPPEAKDGAAGPEASENATEAKSAPEDDIGWSCGACTYNNPTTAITCEMCAAPKSKAFAIVHSESKSDGRSLALVDWSCPMCTYINSASSKQCLMCGSAAAASAKSSNVESQSQSNSPSSPSNKGLQGPKSPRAQPLAAQPESDVTVSASEESDPAIPSADLPWECPVCTYVNEKSSVSCEMCVRARPPPSVLQAPN